MKFLPNRSSRRNLDGIWNFPSRARIHHPVASIGGHPSISNLHPISGLLQFSSSRRKKSRWCCAQCVDGLSARRNNGVDGEGDRSIAKEREPPRGISCVVEPNKKDGTGGDRPNNTSSQRKIFGVPNPDKTSEHKPNGERKIEEDAVERELAEQDSCSIRRYRKGCRECQNDPDERPYPRSEAAQYGPKPTWPDDRFLAHLDAMITH